MLQKQEGPRWQRSEHQSFFWKQVYEVINQ